MCNKCGYDVCSCECDTCGCQGPPISSDCIVSGVSQPVINVVQGDNITQVITNIANTYNDLYQIITNIQEGVIEIERNTGAPTSTPVNDEPIVYVNETNGDIYTWNGTAWILRGALTEIERAPGVPMSTPTGTDPIVYVNETNGDLYTWDGTAWILRGGITLTSIPDTFATGSFGAQISVNNISSSAKEIKTIYTNSSWATFTAANSFIDVTTPTNFPEYRKRWDTRMEFAGVFGIDPNPTSSPSGGLDPATRIITLATLPVGFRPAKIKRFPAILSVIHTTAADTVYFHGFLDVSTLGVVSFTSVGCGQKDDGSECAVSWASYLEVEGLNIQSGQIWINDMHYYTQA